MALGLFGGDSDAGKPREFNLSGNPFFAATLDRTKGPDFMQAGPAGALAALQAQLFGDAGLFQGMATDNAGADLAGSLGMDFLGGLQAFSPEQIAQQQFGLLNPLLQEQFDQSNLDLEGRLFSQGRLGSTSGSNQFNAQLDSQEDARRKLLFDSFGQGLQAQQQQFGLGSGLLQLDPTLRGLFQNLGNNSLQGGLGIQGAANDTFRALAGSQGVNPQGGGFDAGNFLKAGLLNAGLVGLTGGAGALFAPAAAAAAPQASAFLGGTQQGFLPPGGGIFNSAGGGV